MAEKSGLKLNSFFTPIRVADVGTVSFGPDIRRAVFTVYAPPGIAASAVRQHLDDILQNAQTVAPAAQVELLRIFGAGLA